MISEFQITRRVEFADTDMAGIMHFSNFFRFVESCEHAFYRHLGCPIHGDGDGIGWPRVHAACDFKAPLHYDDEATVHLLIREMKTKAICYAFRILRPDGVVAASGSLTVVAVHSVDGKFRATHLPETLRSQLAATSPERLTALGL